MGLFDAIFGDGGAGQARGMVNSAVEAGAAAQSAAIAYSRAERSVILGSIRRTVEEARILGRYSSRLEDAGTFQAVRGRAAASRRRAGAGGRLSGPGALSLGAEDRGVVATLMDASATSDLRRRQATLQLIGQLQGQAGQISTAGTSAELAAITQLAGQRIDAASALAASIMHSKAGLQSALLGAVGGGVAGYFMGGDD